MDITNGSVVFLSMGEPFEKPKPPPGVCGVLVDCVLLQPLLPNPCSPGAVMIGHYQILKHLGAGSYGEVTRALTFAWLC